MRLYHPTRHAAEILREGFGENTGAYLTESDRSGVWLFDKPVDKRMGGGDDADMLTIEIPDALALAYETGDRLPYRQFLMPAGLLNLYGPPQVMEEAR